MPPSPPKIPPKPAYDTSYNVEYKHDLADDDQKYDSTTNAYVPTRTLVHEPAYVAAAPDVEMLAPVLPPRPHSMERGVDHSKSGTKTPTNDFARSSSEQHSSYPKEHIVEVESKISRDGSDIVESQVEKIIVPDSEFTRNHTCQVFYPILYIVLAATSLIMGIVGRWEKQSETKYKALQPIMLTAMTISAIMFFPTFTHSMWLLASGRSRWHNSKKTKSTPKIVYSVLCMVGTVALTLLFLVSFLIMLVNFEQFHNSINMLTAVTWWCSLIVSTPILAWLNARDMYDLISMARRPPIELKS